jgi:fatty acid desaturase
MHDVNTIPVSYVVRAIAVLAGLLVVPVVPSWIVLVFIVAIVSGGLYEFGVLAVYHDALYGTAYSSLFVSEWLFTVLALAAMAYGVCCRPSWLSR